METTLCELGVETRQALIVVPHRQSVKVARRQSSSSSNDVDRSIDADNSGGWGYFGYLRTALSYVNPLGYFGYLRTALSYVNPLAYLRGNSASSNPEQLANEGSQQYRSRSGPWNRPGIETASEHRPLPGNRSQQAATDSSGNTLRRRPRQFGGNIHTLRSEDEGPSDDRNVFWNGNSTEFGGDDKK